jgi:succinoglycan biosynthesis transport protein ExoP
MMIIDLFRLLKKNLFLLLLTPIVLAGLVTYLTKTPTYTYSSETTLYTGIASGSSVEMDKSFSLFATNTAFDNLINVIKSRETQQEVAIRLLALHLMLPDYSPKYISKESFSKLRTITPEHIRKLLVDKAISKSTDFSEMDTLQIEDNFSFNTLENFESKNILPASINKDAYEQTVRNLEEYMSSNDTNFVYKLLYFTHPHYSIKAISSINVQRIQSSDLVKLKYDSDDPGICQLTLTMITEVCINNYKLIKENRSDAVVKYFEYQLKQAAARLKVGEDKLLKFNEDQNIINYYEQSKAIAIVKEDLDNEYNTMRINLAGNLATIQRIEEKLGVQKQIQLKSTSIIELRNKLSSVNSSILTAETIGYGKTIDNEQLAKLKADAEKLKEQISKSVNELYSFGNSTDGLPVSKLLTDWISNVLEYEYLKAGMAVLAERIKEFQKQYAIYAPAGANIKRIEREINVSEQEFLQILYGLNLAKLKMQDAELSSTIKAVDPPFFPLSPNPTKRKVLILAAAMIGFIFILSLILALEYFDETVKNPEKLSKNTKLKSIGIFPKIFLKTGTLNFVFVTNRLLEIVIQQLELLTKAMVNRKIPRIFIFLSAINNEGKTIIAGNIALKLKKQGKKILFLNFTRESLRANEIKQIGYSKEPPPVSTSGVVRKGRKLTYVSRILGGGDQRIDPNSPFLKDPKEYLEESEYVEYLIGTDYFNSTNYQNLIQDQIIKNSQPDYVIIEIPPILYYSYPSELIASADLTMLICRANRSWTDADNGALETLKKITKCEPVALLNGVEINVVETVLGDLPKKRSLLRRKLKKIVRFQYFTKSQF